MAVRGWGGSIVTAMGVAAGAGAAQLGLGYGLGIIAWVPAADDAGDAAWYASLAWATWVAAVSVVAGAVLADRLGGVARTPAAVPPLSAALWRLALAVAAAVGALVTVALVAIPARTAERADTFSPQTIAAGYAVVGVIIGLFVAIAALAARAVATNVGLTAGWLWLLATAVVINGVAAGRASTTAQLGAWHVTRAGGDYWLRNLYLPAVALALGSALVLGALAAWLATRRGGAGVGTAVSGAVGPLLVASAYLLAAPRLVPEQAPQLSAYLTAPYAVVAGLLGSVFATAVVRRRRRRPGGLAGGGAVAPLQRSPDPAE
ncbi:MAG TPA: hypothetical protein VES42_29175, partial [Pilimelia sp.]|nr:hypothetical protein [Pilimelia sp.]